MNWRFIVFLSINLALVGCAIPTTRPTPAVIINNNRIEIEIAQTDAEQTRGLSNRPALPADSGMLFIFPQPKIPVFWMKEMRFPLDFIWINNNAVVDITADVPSPTSTVLLHYRPDQPVSYVLEVNAGWTKAHGVKIGDQVKFIDIITSTP